MFFYSPDGRQPKSKRARRRRRKHRGINLAVNKKSIKRYCETGVQYCSGSISVTGFDFITESSQDKVDALYNDIELNANDLLIPQINACMIDMFLRMQKGGEEKANKILTQASGYGDYEASFHLGLRYCSMAVTRQESKSDKLIYAKRALSFLTRAYVQYQKKDHKVTARLKHNVDVGLCLFSKLLWANGQDGLGADEKDVEFQFCGTEGRTIFFVMKQAEHLVPKGPTKAWEQKEGVRHYYPSNQPGTVYPVEQQSDVASCTSLSSVISNVIYFAPQRYSFFPQQPSSAHHQQCIQPQQPSSIHHQQHIQPQQPSSIHHQQHIQLQQPSSTHHQSYIQPQQPSSAHHQSHIQPQQLQGIQELYRCLQQYSGATMAGQQQSYASTRP